MISCLMVTQPGRERQIAKSLMCFRFQTLQPRELVIVHDAKDDFHQYLVDLTSDMDSDQITIMQAPTGQSLGAMRNLSLDTARYSLFCQWDDDDLYHPERLEIQCRTLVEQQADFCFLTDQLHLFEEKSWMFWDDWRIEGYPDCLIQGTIMGKTGLAGRYPELSRGEDTPLVRRLVDQGLNMYTLSDHGWLYIYVHHGANAWDEDHHKAISRLKHRGYQSLAANITRLRSELARYPVELDRITLPYPGGSFEINPGTGGQSD